MSPRRWIGLTIGAVAVVLLAVWLAVTMAARGPAPTGGGTVVAGTLDDLLMDLQLLPLDGQAPKPFALESLDGRRLEPPRRPVRDVTGPVPGHLGRHPVAPPPRSTSTS